MAPPALLPTANQAAPLARARLLEAAVVVGFALLTALAARIAIPVPGTPVPITLQTLAVLLTALTLGPRLGTLSMALYLAMGLAGLPVFAADGGAPPAQALFGATGGYLLGFLLAPVVVERFATRRDDAGRRLPAGPLGVSIGITFALALIYTLGAVVLRCSTDWPWRSALVRGVYPFLIGDAVKAAIAVAASGPLVARRLARAR